MVGRPRKDKDIEERTGTGTLDMIARCAGTGLPEPDFRQEGGQFILTIWRDWLTDEVLATLDLNERQKKAIKHLKINQRITSADYQRFIGTPRRTAIRDLNLLVQAGLIGLQGSGRRAHYVLKKRAKNEPNEPRDFTEQ